MEERFPLKHTKLTLMIRVNKEIMRFKLMESNGEEFNVVYKYIVFWGPFVVDLL